MVISKRLCKIAARISVAVYRQKLNVDLAEISRDFGARLAEHQKRYQNMQPNIVKGEPFLKELRSSRKKSEYQRLNSLSCKNTAPRPLYCTKINC